MTWAEKIIEFNNSLELNKVPKGFEVMNPYDEELTRKVSEQFYRKYYREDGQRKLILGINPGRLGAGYTGIPFTDPKHVKALMGIEMPEMKHEPSSVFVYDVIHEMGGPEEFYKNFYISSVCPLGFTAVSNKGRVVNRNYYDDDQLQESVTSFIIQTLEHQLEFGIDRKAVFVMGTSKNYAFLNALNQERHYFEQVIPVPHPRFVMQYRLKKKDLFIQEYVGKLNH
jgi:hypothetical protein